MQLIGRRCGVTPSVLWAVQLGAHSYGRVPPASSWTFHQHDIDYCIGLAVGNRNLSKFSAHVTDMLITLHC